MKIRKFKKLKENKYEIEIDETKIVLYDDVIIKYNLLLKKDISKNEMDNVIKENDKQKSYYMALKFIGKRLRTEKEIMIYLKNKEVIDDDINYTISQLKKNNFINDKLYLESYINDQILLSNNGPYKIKNDLLKLNFLEEKIDFYLNNISSKEWLLKIEKTIKKRAAINKKDSNKIFKEKTYHYLLNLGYSDEMFNDILNNVNIIDKERFQKDLENIKIKLSKKYSPDKLNYYLKQKLYAKGYSPDLINEYLNQ